MTKFPLLIGLGIFLVSASGCSVSSVVGYQPSATVETDPKVEKVHLTIRKFDDRRPGVTSSDPRSSSYVRHKAMGSWGMTYKGRRFIPVSDLVQDVLRLEFESAGYDIAVADNTTPKGYILEGTILTFGYDVEQRFPKSAFLRQAALTIALRDESGATIAIDPVINVTTREDGWGGLVSEEIDKLVDETLKEAARQIVLRVTAAVE